MAGWSRKVVPPSRSHRRTPRFGIGLPPRRPRQSGRARLGDPTWWLRVLILAAAVGLAGAPLALDGYTLAVGPTSDEGCRVLSVTDGDTLRLWCPGGVIKTRLHGFDAPEVFSPRCAKELMQGIAASYRLRLLFLGGRTLTIGWDGDDRYGRRLAAIQVDGRSLAEAMIAGGHGRAYAGGVRKGWCAA